MSIMARQVACFGELPAACVVMVHICFMVLQMESLAAISCGICLFNSHTGNAPSPVTLSADTQLLQAGRLLTDIQAAAAQAEAALDHHNTPQQHTLAATNPALAAVAAAYLGSSSGGSAAGPGGANSSIEGAQLGAVLFCCQAAVALRTLAVDLSAGISCCRQLHNELLSVLSQVNECHTQWCTRSSTILSRYTGLECPLSRAAAAIPVTDHKHQTVWLCFGAVWVCRLRRSQLRCQGLQCPRSRCSQCLSPQGACTWR